MKKIVTYPYLLIVFVLILCSGGMMSGCKKYLDVQSSRLTKEKDFWHSIEDVRSNLFGIYGLLRAAMVNENGYWLMGDVRMGDFKGTGRQDIRAIRQNELNFNSPVIQDLANWRRFYAVIDNANLFLENAHRVLEEDPRYTEANYRVDMAQARALRAFTYFYIVRIWGDVPFITASEDGSFVRKKRTDFHKILAFATSELLKAAKDLPYVYGSNSDPILKGDYYNADNARWTGVLINKVSAYAILAHIAAWEGNYVDAAVYAEYVMSNYIKVDADYVPTEVLTGVSGLFFGHNANQLFSIVSPWSHREGNVNGHIEDLTLASPITSKNKPDIYVTKDSILSIFHLEGDQRFRIDSTGKPQSTYFTNYEGVLPIFSKIKIIRNGTTDGSFAVFSSALVFTRVEEMALLDAEALTVLSKNQGSNSSIRQRAIDRLNAVRKERGLPRYLSSDGTLINAIFQERRRELMGEGWRWYDQVRHHRITRNNPEFNELLDGGGIYWPIATEVLEKNPQLVQNKFWN